MIKTKHSQPPITEFAFCSGDAMQAFRHPDFGQVCMLTDQQGQPWFIGKEIAQVLGYVLPTKAIEDHVEKEDRKMLTYKAFSKTVLGFQLWQGQDYSNKMLINESGLYSLIFGSTLPEARKFKRWVTTEVLPQIRRTGGYIPVSQEDDAETLMRKAAAIAQSYTQQESITNI